MRQLASLPLLAPGSLGLNTEDSLAQPGPLYALEAKNAVIDANGRLAQRSGTVNQTGGTAAGATIRQLHEYRRDDGSSEIIASWDGGISNSIASPGSVDIAGTVPVSDGNWRFVNFNDQCWGFSASNVVSDPIRYTGAGSFQTVTPQQDGALVFRSGVAHAAFGRIWTLASDGQTIMYSALLDGTDYREASGGGLIDMRKVWTQGTDKVRGIYSFNGALLVFGLRHIVFWVDGQGNALGLDPTQMYVSDVIEGTGLLARDSIQAVGETDLLYLSPHGVQSLRRVIQERSAPVRSLSDHNAKALLYDANSALDTWADIRSAYDPALGAYILSIPSAPEPVTWVADVSRRFLDPSGRELARMTTWTLAPAALLARDNGQILMSGSTTGTVSRYSGTQDEGADISFRWLSPWFDLSQLDEALAARLKILKRIAAIVYANASVDLTFTWAYDFSDVSPSSRVATIQTDDPAEYGIAEYGLAEYGGAGNIAILRVPTTGKGQYIQLGIEKTDAADFALQQIRLFAKIGRLA